MVQVNYRDARSVWHMYLYTPNLMFHVVLLDVTFIMGVIVD